MIDAAKRAAIVALEHHHLIRPDAPIRHLLAKTFRHGAEILADHHAAMRHAFLRGRRQQRLERHLHIDAVVGGKAVRHQIKPLQAQHVIEPDRAGIAHRGPQHLPKRLEGFDFETGGVEAGKAPVLARGVERIRRRADREMAGNRDLLVPGIEPVGLHADGDVEIETDLHAELGREIAAGLQLPVGGPLHEFDEFDLGGIRALRASAAHLASSGCRHSSGHSHHGLLNLCRSVSKQAKRDSSGARSARNLVEGGMALWLWDRP